MAVTNPSGSSDPKMILVANKPGLTGWQWLLRFLILMVVAVSCLVLGYYLGIRNEIAIIQERTDLKHNQHELQQQLVDIQGKAAIHKHGSEVERRASERLRQENILLQNRVSDLEEAVSFYKSIMVPQKGNKGLKVERMEIAGTYQPGRYKFKLVLTQVADNSAHISGKVKLNLLGIREGKKQSLPFGSISSDIESEGAKFKFRYFQDVKGEIVIPGDFLPEQVEVIAESKGRKATRLEKRFDWNVQEVVNNVGKR